MEPPIRNKPPIRNTFAADGVVFRIGGFTVIVCDIFFRKVAYIQCANFFLLTVKLTVIKNAVLP